MEQAFAEARPVAQHCAELIRRRPPAEARAELLADWRVEVARSLGAEVAMLLSCDKVSITLGEPEYVSGQDAFDRIGSLGANSLLRCGVNDSTVLLTLDYATAIAITDRSFGGLGKLEDDVPARLPQSASLLIDELGSAVARSLSSRGANGEDRSATAVPKAEVIARSERAARLKPFGLQDPCVLVELAIADPAGDPWKALLAMAEEQLDLLLPGLNSAPVAPHMLAGSAPGAFGPFAEIPLPLDASMGEIDLTLAQLEALAPGDEIPFAVAREIPLRAGEQVFAFGSLGTLEERLAIRLKLCKSEV
ncbi:MAG: FliM/FliN family flagellar motor C-terminal domain-containing protein, partial [Pseudomonadota bacterium]